MKRTDLMMISLLRENARIPLTEMSRKTNIPVSTLFDRLRANENKIIIKHTSLLDFYKVGFNTIVYLLIKADKDTRKELGDYLLKNSAVNSLHKISNGYDLMVEAVFRHVNEMQEFIEQIEERFEVEDLKYFFRLESLKSESFMSPYNNGFGTDFGNGFGNPV